MNWQRSLMVMIVAAPFLMPGSELVLAQTQAENENRDLAACQDADKNADASLESCTRLLEAEIRESSQRQAMVLTFRALAWRVKGDVEKAAVDFTQAISVAPNFVPARLARADLLRDNDQCDLALADYDEAIKLAPERAPAYVSRALCLIQQNEAVRAAADLDQVIKLDANNTQGQAILARALKARLNISEGNLDGAIANFEEAIKLDGKLPALRIERGTVWSAKGEDEKAHADLDEAIKLDADNAGGFAIAAWGAKALLHLRKSDLDAAVADYDAAIKLDPKAALLHVERASVWSRKNDRERALADYGKAIELEPNNAAFYNARGDFHRGDSDYAQAIKDYDQAIEKQPGELAGFANRSLARFYLGEFAQAADDLKRIADGQPNAYPMLLHYVSMVRGGGKRDDARDALEKRAAKLKKDEWPYPLVELYLGERSLDAAMGAAKKPEERCEAQFYIGEWHLLRSKQAPATKALQAAAETCPKEFVEYRGAVEELKRLK